MTDREYYVYGLMDPDVYEETKDPVLSLFYVGKGSGDREKQHQRSVENSLRREDQLRERYGSKDERIRLIVEADKNVETIRLSSGYTTEDAAYRAESLAIDLVNGVLRAAGRRELTNAMPGHHAGFVRIRDHFNYIGNEPMVTSDGGSRRVILVKGTSESLDAGVHEASADQTLPPGFEPFAAQVVAYDDADERVTRRGWDPDDPWTDEEARERACRYWRLGRRNVLGWLAGEERPRRLLLGIPGHAGTAVRYAWDIDYSEPWECYDGGDLWGVPLGERIADEPTLGHVLYRKHKGREVQALYGHIQGSAVLDL